jgi:hypothetical protein
MAVLKHYLTYAAAGLIIGGLLKIAEFFGVLPWALGFMLICLAGNMRARTPWAD